MVDTPDEYQDVYERYLEWLDDYRGSLAEFRPQDFATDFARELEEAMCGREDRKHAVLSYAHEVGRELPAEDAPSNHEWDVIQEYFDAAALKAVISHRNILAYAASALLPSGPGLGDPVMRNGASQLEIRDALGAGYYSELDMFEQTQGGSWKRKNTETI